MSLQLDLSNLKGLEKSPPAPSPRHTDPGHSQSCAAPAPRKENLSGLTFWESTKSVLGDAGLVPWCAQLGSICEVTVLWSKGQG